MEIAEWLVFSFKFRRCRFFFAMNWTFGDRAGAQMSLGERAGAQIHVGVVLGAWYPPGLAGGAGKYPLSFFHKP